MSTISASTTSSTAYKVAADTTGTLVFQTGATPTTAVTIDASQNVGVGVTPSAWTLKAVQNGNAAFWTSATNAYLSSNLYYGSGGRTYISNGYSSELGLSTGGFQFQISASGTAGGAITQTQAMTLDSSGNLLVGQTTKSQSTLVFTQRQAEKFLARWRQVQMLQHNGTLTQLVLVHIVFMLAWVVLYLPLQL